MSAVNASRARSGRAGFPPRRASSVPMQRAAPSRVVGDISSGWRCAQAVGRSCRRRARWRGRGARRALGDWWGRHRTWCLVLATPEKPRTIRSARSRPSCTARTVSLPRRAALPAYADVPGALDQRGREGGEDPHVAEVGDVATCLVVTPARRPRIRSRALLLSQRARSSGGHGSSQASGSACARRSRSAATMRRPWRLGIASSIALSGGSPS